MKKTIIPSLLIFAGLLASCSMFNTEKPKQQDNKIKTECSIGLDYPARPSERALIFNGDLKLGTAGFAVKNYYELSATFRKGLPELETIKTPDGKGECLEIKSIDGSPRFILLGREVYIPKKMELEFSFEGRIIKTPGAEDPLFIGLDFRFTNPGKIKDPKQKYCISGGGIKLTEKWQKKTIKVSAPKPGYYRYFFFTRVSPKKLLPTVLLRNISLTGKGLTPDSEIPQAALYTNKMPPAYSKGEKVVYTVKAQLPDCGKNAANIELQFYNEQTKKIIYSGNVEVKKDSEGVYKGKVSLLPPEYGPFGAQVRYDGKVIDSFGGETLVLHPTVNHKRNNIGWRIGGNYEGFRHYRRQPDSDKRIFYNVSVGQSGTPEKDFELFRLAGIQTLRTWYFPWKYIESEKGQKNFEHLDRMIDMHRKYNIDLIGVLGPNLNISGRTGKADALPEWVQEKSKPHKVSNFHPQKGMIPPNALWAEYCKMLMKRYQNNAAAWELLNEPKGWCSTEEYMELLKTTRKAADSISNDIKIIGPCPTGDGDSPRFMEWSKRIINAGGEKYFDGFSFHPYGAGNDFQKGEYFASTSQINKLKALLKKPKKTGLWDTECFQLSNKKYMRCDRWDASTALRHMLIQLGNNVKLAASFDAYELRKDRLNQHVRIITPWVYERIPAPICAALNFLSFKLQDASKAKSFDTNSFARTYMFSGNSNGKALGVAWYLRPDGCLWEIPKENANMEFFDMFGNKLEPKDGKIKLGYDPVYISGRKKDVGDCLMNSMFIPEGDIVDIKGRLFKDTLFLCAKNNMGKAESLKIKFEKTPFFSFPESCEFAFAQNIYCTARVPFCANKKVSAKELKYKTFLQGKHFSDGKIKILPTTKCFDLPFEGAAPLKLTLDKGSEAEFIATKNNLCITVKVKDKNVMAAPMNLWDGDALEIFIDTAPVSNLDVSSAKTVSHYVFAAKPSKKGDSIWSKLNSAPKAESKSTLTNDGYIIEAKIPWASILPYEGYFPPLLYGIELEIDHVSPDKKSSKESLSDSGLPAWKQRLHYPMFKLPEKLKELLADEGLNTIGINGLKNGSLERKGKRSMPAFWWIGPKGFWSYGTYGINGKAGIKLHKPEKESHKRLYITASQKILCEKFAGREAIVEILAKGESLKRTDSTIYNPGIRLFSYFRSKESEKALAPQGLGLKTAVAKPFGWSIIQYPVRVPANAHTMTVSCGFSGKGCAGELYISNVFIKTASTRQ